MSTTFKSLLSSICAIELNYKRINDVEIGEGVYTIAFRERTDLNGEKREFFCLKDEKGNEYALSIKQLAGLRITESASSVKAKWFDEFKSDPNCTVFQERAKELMEKNVDLSTVKFKVVAQLKIRNENVTGQDVPVYQDYCYSGRNEYRTKVRELIARVKLETKGVGNYWDSAEYRTTMQSLRETLQSTPLLSNKTSDAHVVKLPIFQIV